MLYPFQPHQLSSAAYNNANAYLEHHRKVTADQSIPRARVNVIWRTLAGAGVAMERTLEDMALVLPMVVDNQSDGVQRLR